MPDIFTIISPSGIPIDPDTLRRIAEEGQAGKIGKGDIPDRKWLIPGYWGPRSTGRFRRTPGSSRHTHS
jgi:hypothetical protein